MRTTAPSPLARALPSLDGVARDPGPTATDRATSPDASSFTDALGRAVAGVDALQVAADRDAHQVALGSGNLHETALALEKADISLRVAVKVRNKLVEAYQDVMRMSV